MNTIALVLSCEHAVNTIPSAYKALFAGYAEVLNTHRAIDIGAYGIAKGLSKRLDCVMYSAQVSRLLIDCNRSLRNPSCFSEYSKALSPLEKQSLLARYYLPYRQSLTDTLQTLIAAHHSVLHISVHSFTPVLEGVKRNADIGLLYDASVSNEKKTSLNWKRCIQQLAPNYRVRMNYPYRGNSDGFTTYLRKRFNSDEYQGIELEINQDQLQTSKQLWLMETTLAKSIMQLRLNAQGD